MPQLSQTWWRINCMRVEADQSPCRNPSLGKVKKHVTLCTGLTYGLVHRSRWPVTNSLWCMLLMGAWGRLWSRCCMWLCRFHCRHWWLLNYHTATEHCLDYCQVWGCQCTLQPSEMWLLHMNNNDVSLYEFVASNAVNDLQVISTASSHTYKVLVVWSVVGASW
jgi:hypothetical protein